MKSFFIKVPIYEVIVKVTVGDKSLTGVSGRAYSVADGMYWLRFRDAKAKDLHNTLAHECQHLVFVILDRAGMKLCHETQEAYCYLMGFMCEQIYKKI